MEPGRYTVRINPRLDFHSVCMATEIIIFNGSNPGFFPCLPEMHLDHGKYLDLYICISKRADMNDNTVIPRFFPFFTYLRKILFKCRCIFLFILGTIGIIVIIRKPECFILICLWHRFHCLCCLTVWSTGCFYCHTAKKYFQVKDKSVRLPEKIYLFLTY